MTTVHQLNIFQKAGIAVALFLFRLWAATWRVRLTESAKRFFLNQSSAQVVLLWHNRLAMALSGKLQMGSSPHLCGLVSPSRDGAILSEILHHVAVMPVRGSSSHRAVEATRELMTAIDAQSLTAVITPDGPLGPVYRLKDGLRGLIERYRVGLLLPKTAHPIELKSWDRFQIPPLFARVEIDFEEIPSDWDTIVARMAEAAK